MEDSSAMDGVKYGDDYINLFDPDVYLKSYYCASELGAETSPEGDMKMKEMLFLHEAFADNSIKGSRLLDIGTGPAIHSVISASPHVDSIFLSDFAPQNISVLKRWLGGTLQHSFGCFFRFVVDLEGKGDSPVGRERSVQEKISGICSIDMRQEYPLSPSFFPRFDVIMSSLCLDAVAGNIAEYEEIARRVADMLQEGGHLVLFGVLGGTFYKVGPHLFRSLDIDRDQLQNAWKKCGFKINKWNEKSHSIPGMEEVSDFESYFLMVARKEKSA